MSAIGRVTLLFLMVSVFTRVIAETDIKESSGPVSHVVIAWLKKPGDAEARKKFIDTTKSFSTLPGVIDHRVGTVLPSGRKVVDSSFDVATVITFENRKALLAYLKHPRHEHAVKNTLKPLVEKVIVYDIDLK